MLACAILPFLPLIVDAHIRQLGDDDFTKRNAAALFLEKVLRDTDGFRNHDAVVKLKRAMHSQDREVCNRARELYEVATPLYFRENPYVCVLFKADGEKNRTDTKPEVERMKKVCGDLIQHNSGGRGGYRSWQEHSLFCPWVTFRSERFTRTKFIQIKSNKDVLVIAPLTSPLPEIDYKNGKFTVTASKPQRR